MKLIEGVEPFTNEWHEARNGSLTSSLMFKIFVNGTKGNMIGVGGMSYVSLKIGEILTGVIGDEVDSQNVPDDIQRGYAGEPWALERFTALTDIHVYESKLYVYNAIACGTTDGAQSKDGINIHGICEVKCPRPWKHTKILACESALELKEVDAQYYSQMQSNILFTGVEHCDFISYNDQIKHYDLQIKIQRVYPDLGWQKDFIQRIEWIAEYMQSQLEKILKTPERNLQYKIVNKDEKIEKLKTAIENIQNISI